jgi:hypothetical protein
MSIIFYITLAIITNSGAQVIYLDENILAATKDGELCLLVCTKKVELCLVWILWFIEKWFMEMIFINYFRNKTRC